MVNIPMLIISTIWFTFDLSVSSVPRPCLYMLGSSSLTQVFCMYKIVLHPLYVNIESITLNHHEVLRRWRSQAQDDDGHIISLYWLHVMFIFYASYLALFDGSILRWSLTNYQEVFSLSMHRCERSSCWDTTWWLGVIGSTFTYNGYKTVLHMKNTRVKLDKPSICRYGLGTLRPKGRTWTI